MTIHIALLRAVNLPGHGQVAMADLRSLVERLGFVNVRSLLQSGNLVFGGRGRSTSTLERLLESEALKRLELRTEFFVRTLDEWKAIVAENPFRNEAKRDPSHLTVVVFKDPPATASVLALQGAISGREVVRARGRHAYIAYPDGIGRSRLTLALIERKLGTHGTARNWNTVLKLDATAGA